MQDLDRGSVAPRVALVVAEALLLLAAELVPAGWGEQPVGPEKTQQFRKVPLIFTRLIKIG